MIVITIHHTDPADTMFDILLAADIKFENDLNMHRVIIEAMSARWPQVCGALSTGPNVYARLMFNRALSRRELFTFLKDNVKVAGVQLPDCESSFVVRDWLRLARIQCEIAPEF